MSSLPRTLLVLVLATASPSGAEVIVSNLANTANDGYALFYNQWLAQGFFNDGETRHLVRALVNVGNNFGSGGIVAEIRTSDGGDPGSVVGTLTPTAPALTFLPAAPIELAPNAAYFLVLGFPIGNPNTTGAWKATADLASTGVASLTEPRYSHDQGVVWQSAGFATQRLRLEIEAEVPEPRASLLAASAIATLVGVASLRTKR
jgi:hypothetical protein